MLDLDCALLLSLGAQLFLHTPELKYLVLANAKLAPQPQQAALLLNDTFRHLQSLTHIYLAGFDLNTLQDGTVFEPLTSLQVLFCCMFNFSKTFSPFTG